MKLRVGNYEIEIKAKDINTGRGRNNISDTINILNELSIACDMAAKSYQAAGYVHMAESMRKNGSDIYEALVKVGAYRDI